MVSVLLLLRSLGSYTCMVAVHVGCTSTINTCTHRVQTAQACSCRCIYGGCISVAGGRGGIVTVQVPARECAGAITVPAVYQWCKCKTDKPLNSDLFNG